MPFYEYRCKNCGQTIEIIKKISESDSIEICPKCNLYMQKSISINNFKLGKGFWFKNNYNKD